MIIDDDDFFVFVFVVVVVLRTKKVRHQNSLHY
jgi:hypothetical protein